MLHYAQMLTCDGAEACPKYFVRVAAGTTRTIRVQAAANGWLYSGHDGKDYCPEHKAAADRFAPPVARGEISE